jgi:hypothetical protein
MPTTSARRTVYTHVYTHDCHHGFCTVCGSVWPCSRATRTPSRQAPPIPRPDALGY